MNISNGIDKWITFCTSLRCVIPFLKKMFVLPKQHHKGCLVQHSCGYYNSEFFRAGMTGDHVGTAFSCCESGFILGQYGKLASERHAKTSAEWDFGAQWQS